MSATLNQSEFSLGSDHERGNTKKTEGVVAKMQKNQIEQHECSDKKEVSVGD